MADEMQAQRGPAKPSIGRIVQYSTPDHLFEGGYDSQYGQSQVMAAIITGVHDDAVNLTAFPDGCYPPFQITSVFHISKVRAASGAGHFWAWPSRV